MHPPTPSAKSGREYFFLVYIYCISRFSNGRRCGKELGLQKLFNIVPRSQNGVYDTIFSGNVTGINCLAFKMVLDCRNSCAQLSGFGNLNCCRGFYWHYHFLQCICIFINLYIVCKDKINVLLYIIIIIIPPSECGTFGRDNLL